jgi:hypothetical protein
MHAERKTSTRANQQFSTNAELHSSQGRSYQRQSMCSAYPIMSPEYTYVLSVPAQLNHLLGVQTTWARIHCLRSTAHCDEIEKA